VYRAPTLKKLDVGAIPKREMLAAIVEKYEEYMDLAQRFYTLWTSQQVWHVEDGDDTVWAVRESRYASAEWQALNRKARMYEEKVVERVNEYAEQLVQVYYDVEDKDG
jgi:hypothetical protein